MRLITSIILELYLAIPFVVGNLKAQRKITHKSINSLNPQVVSLPPIEAINSLDPQVESLPSIKTINSLKPQVDS